MDAGLTIRPVAGGTIADFARLPTVYLPAGAPTELPTTKVVNPVAQAPATRPEASSTDYTTHDVTIDSQIREVIYRVIDTRTRQVIRQVPDEILLRTRAYSKAIEDGRSPFAAQAQADIEA
jgi:hypothetical protein